MENVPLRIILMGEPRVMDPDGETLAPGKGKPLAVLTYLTCHPEGVRRSELASIFWPESPRQRARASVRQALWTLRRQLGEDLFNDDDPVVLTEGLVETDLQVFDQALKAGDAQTALELWEAAPFRHFHLPGCPQWEEWTDGVRMDLERRFGSFLLEKSRGALGQSRPSDALKWLNAAVEVEPHRGDTRRILVETLLELRHFGEAEAVLSRARARQADGPGSDPGLEELEERITRLRRGVSQKTPEKAPWVDPPFLGRRNEYAELMGLWRQAQDRAPRVAAIIGEAGIGKSRLAAEVALAAKVQGGCTVRVKAVPTEEELSLGMVGDLVRRLLPLPGGAGVSMASDRVLRALTPSLDTDPRADGGADPRFLNPASVADALQDLVDAVAGECPLVLVLDDLQWMDRASRKVLIHVLRRLRDQPVLALVTCRASSLRGEMGDVLDLLTAGSGGRIVGLEPWSRDEVSRLVWTMVQGAADAAQADRLLEDPSAPITPDSASNPGPAVAEVTDRLYAVAGGNPLFTLELLGLLHEMGVLEGDAETGWTLHPNRLTGELSLPDHVRTVIGRQLDRLSPDATLLAANLALASAPPTLEELAQRTQMEGPPAARAVAELIDRGVVRWEDGDRLVFVHDELRVAARERFEPLVFARRSKVRRRTAAVAGVVASAAVLLLLFASHQGPFSSTTVAPFGGGTIVLGGAGQVRVLPVGAGPMAEWETQTAPEWVSPATAVRVPFLDATGELSWLIRDTSPTGKPWVSLASSDGPRSVYQSDGDDSAQDVSPDGTHLLVFSEPRSAPSYRHDMYLVPLPDWVTERGERSEGRDSAGDDGNSGSNGGGEDGRRETVVPDVTSQETPPSAGEPLAYVSLVHGGRRAPGADGAGVGSDRNVAASVISPHDGGPVRAEAFEPILRGQHTMGSGRISPDGRRIAARLSGEVDSLTVLNPRGERTFTVPVGRIGGLSWCGGSERLIMMQAVDGAGALGEVALDSGEWTPLTVVGVPGSQVACSPDGTAVVYPTLHNGEITYVIQELETGDWHRLLGVDYPSSWIRWLPEEVRPIPERLELRGAPAQVDWGERRFLNPRLVLSDGSEREADSVMWQTSDPAVVTVSPGGLLQANGRGVATIRARWDGWFEAEAEVEVVGEEGGGAILVEPFDDLDEGRWVQVGWPPSRIVVRDGERVLNLAGDALYRDGITTRRARSYPRGVTVELEFQLPLTRRDKQWFFLCLLESELPPDPDEGFERADLDRDQEICVRYPFGLLVSMDPAAADLRVVQGFPSKRLELNEPLPNDDWTHLAVQMRADGEVSVFVNRELVGTSPLRARNDTDTRWRILLIGSSWETEALARDLYVWEGPRYE